MHSWCGLASTSSCSTTSTSVSLHEDYMASVTYGASLRSSSSATLPHQQNNEPLAANVPRTTTLQQQPVTPRIQDARVDLVRKQDKGDGYYQVSELSFTFTLPCENCSRVVKLYPTDWGDYCTTVQPEASVFAANILSSQILDDKNAIARNLGSSGLTGSDPSSVLYLVTRPPMITFNNYIFTANEAGFYSLGPDSTLIPGGQPVTIDGTAIQLDCDKTKVVIGGSTSELKPITVTVTSVAGFSGSNAWNEDISSAIHSTSSGSASRLPLSMASPTNKATSMGNALKLLYGKVGDWRGALVLVLVAIILQERMIL